MLNGICTTIGAGYLTGIYGLANITISSFDVFLAYLVAIVVSIIFALILKVPLLPSKPYRYSFDVSALYPTPIIAIGIVSLLVVLNHGGILLAAIIGILSALFVKYLFFMVFPRPSLGEDANE